MKSSHIVNRLLQAGLPRGARGRKIAELFKEQGWEVVECDYRPSEHYDHYYITFHTDGPEWPDVWQVEKTIKGMAGKLGNSPTTVNVWPAERTRQDRQNLTVCIGIRRYTSGNED